MRQLRTTQTTNKKRQTMKQFLIFTLTILTLTTYGQDKYNYVHYNKLTEVVGTILKDTYEKKLIKTKPLTFWDKTINYNLIAICGLRDNNQTYLTLNDLNNEKKSDSTSWGFWLFIIVGLGITSSGIYLLFVNRKPAANSTLPKAGANRFG